MSAAGRDREQDFLVRVLRRRPHDADPDTAIDIDWDRFRRLAGPSLAPYLITCLKRARVWDHLPAEVRDQLAAVRRANGMAHLLRLRALRDALPALERAGIPVVVLKGMALAHLVYPDPTLRPMQDVDLWTPLQQLDAAVDTLRQAGFQFPSRTYEGRWTPGMQQDADRALEVPGTPIFFELHGSLPTLAGLPPAFATAAFDRATPLPLGDLRARVLAPEDQLLHVALHLSLRHQFRSGLLGLVDLALLVEHWRDRWNWSALCDDYRRLGVAQWMRLSFRLAHLLLDAPIPAEVFRELPPAGDAPEIERLAMEQVWDGGAALPHAFDRVAASDRRFVWIRNRLLSYLRGQPLHLGRRLWFDVVTKVPRYARLWWRGELRGSRLRDRLRLVRARSRLASLVEAAERASAHGDH